MRLKNFILIRDSESFFTVKWSRYLSRISLSQAARRHILLMEALLIYIMPLDAYHTDNLLMPLIYAIDIIAALFLFLPDANTRAAPDIRKIFEVSHVS